ncbi:protein NO VEIN domain-containing protein [Tsukamurella spumae]|uniref:DUF3883 domain-containing protein n=1 Tax=Tsukamurella spumae TaxID=44753 RepID=A0A846X3V5_9ACTN|nr:DUF3883 domain-containing protein [Tsukamurella spumae]NKY19009.1 DUF3883 domain-containing protein [Tsukamurella spumae]
MAGQTTSTRQISKGSRLRGLTADDVTIVAIDFHEDGGATVTFRPDSGGVDERVLSASEPAELQVVTGPGWRFDGDPVVFASAMYIEVKGRILGADTFEVTFSEVMLGKNMGRAHRLALVSVHPDGDAHDQIRYLTDHFRSIDVDAVATTRIQLDWKRTWAAGTEPR